ncbi:hypothetical protein QVD17_19678 [Tagetes erecta]|uniref:Uncharacterized protein n=1 Tax=Tagetes erecta TaxID=13708 RepID=A0AAD8KJU5_TARER|nr:hypothetical protein QVD17_19678 [Tagetes erecta]
MDKLFTQVSVPPQSPTSFEEAVRSLPLMRSVVTSAGQSWAGSIPWQMSPPSFPAWQLPLSSSPMAIAPSTSPIVS